MKNKKNRLIPIIIILLLIVSCKTQKQNFEYAEKDYFNKEIELSVKEGFDYEINIFLDSIMVSNSSKLLGL